MGRKPKAKEAETLNTAVVESTKVIHAKAVPSKVKAESKIISVMDSVTVTISIPAHIVSSLVSKVGPKLKLSTPSSITSVINKIIQIAAEDGK